jgi:hypothetical protein
MATPSIYLFIWNLKVRNYESVKLGIRGSIQNIPDWCRHLYSSCGSTKHRYIVGLLCLVSQCAKLHVAGWNWAVFTSVYLESCTWPVAIFTMDQRKEQPVCIKVSGETQNGCHPPPTALPWFGTLWLLPISKNVIEAERTPVWYHWGDPCRIAESAWHSDRKLLPGSVPKMEETVGPVSTCGRELLRGWWRPIGFMVSFMIFTALVRNILNTHSYIGRDWIKPQTTLPGIVIDFTPRSVKRRSWM